MRASRPSSLQEKLNLLEEFGTGLLGRLLGMAIAIGFFAWFALRTRRAWKRYRRRRKAKRFVVVAGNALGMLASLTLAVLCVTF